MSPRLALGGGARTRATRVLLALAALSLLVAACASDEDTEPAADEDEAEEQDGDEEAEERERAAEQELVVGAAEDGWLDAEGNQKRFPSYPSPNAGVCETLLQLTTDFENEPGLATDWEYVGDNTFEFELREDVEFSDGTPFDAHHVVETFDYLAEEPSVMSFYFVDPGSTEAIDDYTVQITPSRPNMRLFEQINHPGNQMMAEGSDPMGNFDPTCTGPFELVEYEPAERLVVERNDNYWGDQPELDRIEFQFISDSSTRELALQAGDVDAIYDVPREAVPALEDAPGIEIHRAPPGQTMVFEIARRDGDGEERIGAEDDVRQAMVKAIDRQAYVDSVLGGEAEVVDSVGPPDILGEHYDLIEGVTHDPEEAEQLLADAGWEEGDDGVRERDGEPLSIDIVYNPGPIDLFTAEFVQAQLSDVGFDANVQQLESADYSERVGNADYDVNLHLPNQNNADPAFLLSLRYFSDDPDDPGERDPGPDSRYHEMIEEILEETDYDELQRLSAEAMAELVEEEAAVLPLAGTYRIYAAREEVQGIETHPSGINQTWESVYLTE